MRLIDADDIHYCSYDLDNYHSFEAVTEEEIAEMPTIDAVPVVHAKWHKPTPCSQEFCTNCGRTPKTNFGWLPPYCPHCGAKMDLEDEDD